MNKTLGINIAGFAFIIEELAFQNLQNYLNAIKGNFNEEDGREEIMADIEARIAEIFKEKLLYDNREVVLETDVAEVMTIMGMPEDYITDEAGTAQQAFSEERQESHSTQDKTDRKLYKDTENAMIGGVCSGMGYYFGMDATLVRVIFVILGFMGGGVLLYIILLIVLPDAKTTSQKLHMKGQSVNIDSIKDHVSHVKSTVKNGAKEAENTIKKNVDKVVSASGNVLRTVTKIIGISFMGGGILALVFITMLFFFGAGILPIVENGENVGLSTLIGITYAGSGNNGLLITAMLVVVILPVLGIIFSGIKMLFGYTKTRLPISIALGTLWFIALTFVGIQSIKLGMNYRNRAEVKQDIELFDDSTAVLFIDVVDDNAFNQNVHLHNVWNFSELINIENEQLIMGYPQLKIVPVADSGKFEIQLNKESSGLTVKDAVTKAENIDYKVNLNGNKLTVPPYFSVPKKDKIRAQVPTVIVRVPMGKKIIFGNSADRIHIMMSDHKYCKCNYEYAETEWLSDGESLECVACSESE